MTQSASIKKSDRKRAQAASASKRPITKSPGARKLRSDRVVLARYASEARKHWRKAENAAHQCVKEGIKAGEMLAKARARLFFPVRLSRKDAFL
jgi:hypothetical protein